MLDLHYWWAEARLQEPIRCPSDGDPMVIWWRPVTQVMFDSQYNPTPVEVVDGKKTTARYHSDETGFGWTIEETDG
jgi:hypothetical protein